MINRKIINKKLKILKIWREEVCSSRGSKNLLPENARGFVLLPETQTREFIASELVVWTFLGDFSFAWPLRRAPFGATDHTKRGK